MPRRTLLLLVAGVAALLGVLLIVVYVQGIDARARKGQEIVEVLYTRQPITLGTSGAAAQSAGSFELRKVPREDRKSTRLNSSHVSESRMPSSA